MPETTVLALAAAIAPMLSAAEANKRPAKRQFVIDDIDWAVLADEPSQHLALATNYVVRKEFRAAAAEFHITAQHLKLAAKSASEEYQAALASSSIELENLAQGITRDGEMAAAAIDVIVGRAVSELAKDHIQKASQSMIQRNSAATGHYLVAAVREIEQCVRWAGRELEEGTRTALRSADTICGKLQESAEFVTDETWKAISFVGIELEKLGEATLPHHSTGVAARESANSQTVNLAETGASQQCSNGA